MSQQLRLLYDTGFQWAERAEKSKDGEEKARFLKEAMESFVEARKLEKNSKNVAVLDKQIEKFKVEVQELEERATAFPEADELVAQAMKLDQDGLRDKALPLYLKSAEIYLEGLKRPNILDSQVRKWKARADKVLKRVEEISASSNVRDHSQELPSKPPPSPFKSKSPSRKPTVHNRDQDESSSGVGSTISEISAYTEEELKVLRESSEINGKTFPPWNDKDKDHESYQSQNRFVDPDGKLQLSEKQKEHFGGWKRASELLGAKPRMIVEVNPQTIVQEIVADCSFVSSICIAAYHEQTFKMPLITKIIYPQNANGIPRFNPSGKYVVKLWWNGAARKVLVDDFFPVGKDGRWLCSFSSHPNELWVSLIEKAYMKLNGGYDFPGSISGIDLYALTGWIPEVYQIQEQQDDFRNQGTKPVSQSKELSDAKAQETWEKLLSASNHGDVLMTVATGDISPARAEALGLVPTHAYAVLCVREIQGQKLIQLKNPWSRVCWKGSYSAYDTASWTPELQKALVYDPKIALRSDSGIFWIDFGSLREAFAVLYMNWNPDLFASRLVFHRQWPYVDGEPVDDSFTIGENPQYSLRINVTSPSSSPKAASGAHRTDQEKAIVWILLTRHVIHKSQLLSTHKGDFLTLNVYDRDSARRLYYPEKPFIRGIYSNNPHTLVAFQVPPGEHLYTLVVSLYERTQGVNYTITVYSSKHCTQPRPSLMDIPRTLPFAMEVKGKWSKESAGGCPRFSSFFTNPQWSIRVPKSAPPPSMLHCRLLAQKEHSVNIRAFSNVPSDKAQRVSYVNPKLEVFSSGSYRKGICVADLPIEIAGKDVAGHRKGVLHGIKPGDALTIVASTFDPQHVGPYILHVEMDSPFKLSPIQDEGNGLYQMILHGDWIAGSSAAGSPNHGCYHRNPAIYFTIPSCQTFEFIARLQFVPEEGDEACSTWPSLNLSVFKSLQGPSSGLSPRTSMADAELTSNDGVYLNPPSGAVINRSSLPVGAYVMLPSTFTPLPGKFRIIVYTSFRIPFELTPIKNSEQPGFMSDLSFSSADANQRGKGTYL